MATNSQKTKVNVKVGSTKREESNFNKIAVGVIIIVLAAIILNSIQGEKPKTSNNPQSTTSVPTRKAPTR